MRSFERFEWEYDPAHVDGFHLRIYDADAPEDSLPVFELQHWMDTQWTPAEAERAQLPDRIQWEVDALDASGAARRTSERASAWRS